jgi:hypothetical protein
MKKQIKKVRLVSETLLRLEKENLEGAMGGCGPTIGGGGSCNAACTTIRSSCC